MSYSYSPKELVESFQRLKAKEEAKLSTETEDAALEPLAKRRIWSSFFVACVQLTAEGFPENNLEDLNIGKKKKLI